MFPANCKRVFSILIKIVTFDLIPVDPIIDPIASILKTYDDIDLPDNFTEFEYESTNPIENLSFVFLFIVFLSFLPLMIKGIEFLFGWSFTFVQKLEGISKSYIYWNTYLRFMLEAYIELSITCQLRFFTFKFNSISDGILTVFSGLVITVMLLMCFGSLCFLRAKHKSIREQSFKTRFGALTLGL